MTLMHAAPRSPSPSSSWRTLRLGPIAGVLALCSVALPGCPSSTSTPYGPATKAKPTPTPTPAVTADDPRVVERDGELYTQKTIERSDDKRRDDGLGGLGSGKPDETNGECRLFAPKLPHPQCCTADLGFDVDTVRTACGHETYLGESFRFSCGYYFDHPGDDPRWFRLSKINETDAKTAAGHHDRKMTEALGDKYAPSAPVPGVEGAWWSRHEEYRWAFLPAGAWGNVRQLSWNADSCGDPGVLQIIAQLVATPPPPEGAVRTSLVPRARK